MRSYPYTIDNGAGERLTFTRRVRGESGERVEGEAVVAPGAGPPMHVHYLQDEGFTVLRGRLGLQRAGQPTEFAGPGESVVFRAGEPHRFWNAGEEELHCAAYIEPAGNAEFFLAALFDAQKRNGGRRPSLLDLAFLTRRYRTEYAMVEIPAPVQRLVFPLIAATGGLLGRYRRYADAPEPLEQRAAGDPAAADGPHALPSLVQALSQAEAEVAAFFGTLPPEEFVTREGEAWSPAEHVQHLNIAVSATARGFGMSRFVLRLRFGTARRPGRTFGQLKADYLALLAAGGRASGRFVPRASASARSAADVQRETLMRWQRVNARLRAALSDWTERDLDRIRLPHPLLGRITARELVFFTIHHGPHHVAAAKRRLVRFAAAGPAV